RNLRLLRDQLNVPLDDLFTMAAAVPARLLGLDRKGTLAPGVDADFAVYDAGLHCLATFVAGRQVFRAQAPPSGGDGLDAEARPDYAADALES
ncbi:MAG: amidohydrolase family protein, partial [Chloroflexota bacterium]